MGRITDARGDEAYDVLDAFIEAADPIFTDPEIAAIFRGAAAKNTSLMSAIRKIVGRHREEVTRIIALDEGKTVEETKKGLSALAVPVKFVRLMNDPTVRELFFGSAATNEPADGSSSASERGDG